MKKSIVGFLTAVLMCVGSIGLCQVVEMDNHEEARRLFAQLTESAKSALTAPDAAAKSAATGKFSIVGAPHQHAGDAVFANDATAVRVWFELSNGRFVNPRHYRWAPGEVFYVHVQSAVPVYVALYQNFPNNRLPSRRVYPDVHFPDSFQMVMPGVSTRLPVAFQMDPNFLPEHMSIVVTRADWDGIQPHVPHAATTAVSAAAVAYAPAPGGGTAFAAAATGILKSAGAEIKSEEALAKFAIINNAAINNTYINIHGGGRQRVQCRVSFPRFVRPTHYVHYVPPRRIGVMVNPTFNVMNVTNVTNVNIVNYRGCFFDCGDVAFYLFSDNGVGHVQITLNKIGSNWRW